MRYEALLFDIDGTLLDFSKAEAENIFDTLRASGIDPTSEMASAYSDINDSLWKLLEKGEIDRETLKYRRFELLFERYGITADAKKTSATYIALLEEKAYLYDGAIELCKYLSDRADAYIVTNGTLSVQESRLKKSGLLPYFKDVFISEKIGYAKPDPRFFEYAAERIPNFPKEKAVIIGDSLSSDIAGGIAYGIDTVWYSPDNKPVPAELADKITFVARSYAEIKDFLCDGGKK